MASAVCLNQSNETSAHEVVIIAIGAFGAAVAERLRIPGMRVHKGEPFDLDVSKLPLADSYVMVAGHPCPDLEIYLCETILNWKRRFIPIVHEHPYLRSGPITCPGALACSLCYDRRIHQHTVANEIPDYMAKEYIRRGDDVLPRGILPVWADVAAGLIMLRLAGGSASDTNASRRMIGVDLISGGVISTLVIGVDSCRICSLEDDDLLNRSVRDLPSILSAVAIGGEDGNKRS